MTQNEDLTEEEELPIIGFCDARDKFGCTCFGEAVVTCDDCGAFLCPKHAWLHNGIQCPQCMDDYFDQESGDYDHYEYPSNPETDAKISRFASIRRRIRSVLK